MLTKLESLKVRGVIADYQHIELDEYGNPGRSDLRNSERLIITFPGGEKLTLTTWCSGCAENTGFSVE
jgi:hypothetical protein